MEQPSYNATRNQYVAPLGSGGGSKTYAANGAITPDAAYVHVITKTSAAVMTLAPPAAGDSSQIVIIGRTAFAHTVTVTEGLGGKGAGADVMTFGAVGDSIVLQADNAHWVQIGGAGVAVA